MVTTTETEKKDNSSNVAEKPEHSLLNCLHCGVPLSEPQNIEDHTPQCDVLCYYEPITIKVLKNEPVKSYSYLSCTLCGATTVRSKVTDLLKHSLETHGLRAYPNDYKHTEISVMGVPVSNSEVAENHEQISCCNDSDKN